MNPRPQTLQEVARAAVEDPSVFLPLCNMFLDEFYLDHGDKDKQQARIDGPPQVLADTTGSGFHDAWLAAVAEHLALRWELRVPGWVDRPEGFCLTRPEFLGYEAMKPVLLRDSPYPFRRRMIFVDHEPLRRARFPLPHRPSLSEQVRQSLEEEQEPARNP